MVDDEGAELWIGIRRGCPYLERLPAEALEGAYWISGLRRIGDAFKGRRIIDALERLMTMGFAYSFGGPLAFQSGRQLAEHVSRVARRLGYGCEILAGTLAGEDAINDEHYPDGQDEQIVLLTMA